MKTVTEVINGCAVEGEYPDYYNDDKDYTSGDLYLYKVTDMDGDVEYLTFVEAVGYITMFNTDEDFTTEQEAREILEAFSTLHIGPDDDRYTITKLDTPKQLNQYGEMVEVG